MQCRVVQVMYTGIQLATAVLCSAGVTGTPNTIEREREREREREKGRERERERVREREREKERLEQNITDYTGTTS